MVAVKGSPDDSGNSVPSCQPFANSRCKGFHPLLADRQFPRSAHDQVLRHIEVRHTLSAERGSNTGRFETVFVYAVMSEFEPVSRLLDQVYDPWTSRPWLRRF